MSQEKEKMSIGRLLSIALIPLLILLGLIFAFFVSQAHSFSQAFFTGDWATLAFIVLFLEAFFASILSGAFSLTTGFTLALGVGSKSNLIEVLAALLATFFVYKDLFWWFMHNGCKVFGLGSDMLPTALVVYILILPVSQLLTFSVNALACLIVCLVLDFIPGIHRNQED